MLIVKRCFCCIPDDWVFDESLVQEGRADLSQSDTVQEEHRDSLQVYYNLRTDTPHLDSHDQ